MDRLTPGGTRSIRDHDVGLKQAYKSYLTGKTRTPMDFQDPTEATSKKLTSLNTPDRNMLGQQSDQRFRVARPKMRYIEKIRQDKEAMRTKGLLFGEGFFKTEVSSPPNEAAKSNHSGFRLENLDEMVDRIVSGKISPVKRPFAV